MLDVPQTFKVSGSKSQCDIMSRHKKCYTSGMVSCRRSNLVKIIPEPSATCTRNTF